MLWVLGKMILMSSHTYVYYGELEKTRAGVCKTLCPQHLLVPNHGRLCSVIIPQKNFKTLASMVRKILHASDFIQIFSKGITSERETTRTRKQCASTIFP